jgi:hypothetical protein
VGFLAAPRVVMQTDKDEDNGSLGVYDFDAL